MEKYFSSLFNVLFAIAVLIVTSPLILIITIIIKIDSPGPVLFKQTRIKINLRKNTDRRTEIQDTISSERRNADRRKEDCCGGQPFTFYKFRTMKVNAKELYPELYDYSSLEENIKEYQFKIKKDPRLSRVGKWLRRTSMDELPNFINVFKRDIDVVGPRPELPELAFYYTLRQKEKFSVRPGVTGLAQIKGRGNLNFQSTIKYDLEYVKNKSFFYDLKIILQTIWAIIFCIGSF